jgi:hypothetical protein
MDDEDVQFEHELRRGLKRLANHAPSGGGPEGVRGRLRRRAIRRGVSGAAGVGAALVLLAWLVPPQRSALPHPAPVGPRAAPGPSIAQAPLPVAIPRDAAQRTIEAALRRCLAEAGVTGDAWIAKDPQRGLSLAVGGDAVLAPETLQAHLDRLLENFGTVEIALRGGQLQYQLFAKRQDGTSTSAQG